MRSLRLSGSMRRGGVVFDHPLLTLRTKARGVGVIVFCVGVMGGLEQGVAAADRAVRKPVSAVSVKEQSVYGTFKALSGEGAGMWCTNPEEPSEILGVTNSVVDPENAYLMHDEARFSRDGGAHWTDKKIPKISGDQEEGDPACAYGLGGVALYGWMGWSRERQWHYYVSASRDHGDTWSEPVRLPYDRIIDRGFLMVDRGRSPYHGRVYVVGSTLEVDVHPSKPFGPGEILVFASDNNGRSFAAPTRIPTGVVNGNGVIHMGQVAVLEDGTLMVSWTEGDSWGATGMFDAEPELGADAGTPGRSVVKFAKSLDGGKTFQTPAVVSRGRWATVAHGKLVWFAKLYPSIAVKEATIGQDQEIYLAWNGVSAGRVEVLFSRSQDGGSTWSKPRPLLERGAFDRSHPELGPYSGMVTLAVNKEGVLAAYFFSQEMYRSDDIWPVLAVSRDGGRMWSVPLHLTNDPLQSDPKILAMFSGWGSQPLPPKPAYFGWPPTCFYGLQVGTDDGFEIFTLSSVGYRPKIDFVRAYVR
jgi:hypothetical protein